MTAHITICDKPYDIPSQVADYMSEMAEEIARLRDEVTRLLGLAMQDSLLPSNPRVQPPPPWADCGTWQARTVAAADARAVGRLIPLNIKRSVK